MHLSYMFQPYLGKEIHYFTRRLSQKWTGRENPKKVKKMNSIFDVNFFQENSEKFVNKTFFWMFYVWIGKKNKKT